MKGCGRKGDYSVEGERKGRKGLGEDVVVPLGLLLC